MRIDLNADLGEERGDDAAIFPCISSASIACGAHAGGARSIDASLALASSHGVTVGAHVGYEDRENFGRVAIAMRRKELTASLVQQIERLQDRATRFGISVRYVKPHGALYFGVGGDKSQAHALVDAVRLCDPSLELLVPPSQLLLDIAQPLVCRHEFFADRGYHLDGRLVSRSDPRAYVDDATEIVSRTRDWLQTGEVVSVEGLPIRIQAESICLHGDSPLAVRAATELHAALLADGYRLVNWMLP
jgi:UPF0271 protein